MVYILDIMFEEGISFMVVGMIDSNGSIDENLTTYKNKPYILDISI